MLPRQTYTPRRTIQKSTEVSSMLAIIPDVQKSFRVMHREDQFDFCASTSGEAMGTASSTPTEYVPMSEDSSVWPQRTCP